MLVIQSKKKKTDYNTKINEIGKKITDHDHDKYIITPEFLKLTAENFAARLAQANLASKSDIVNFVKKTDFDDKLKNLNKKLYQIKQNIYQLKMNLKNCKHLIQVFLLAKVTLIMMERNFTYYFNQLTKLLQLFLVLQTQSQNGNLRDYQMKKLLVLIQQM